MGCVTSLEERMKKCDFEYQYSDSYAVFKEGQNEKMAIIQELKALPQNIAYKLIQDYVPLEYRPLFFLSITGKGL